MHKIGVFDSGVGGAGVAAAIQQALPKDMVMYTDDHEHIPYGTKPPEEIKGYVVPILEALVAEGCEVIVIACNTVTTTIIEDLRKIISVPLIGMEPMVKPAAAATKSGTIAVCATPTTLASTRYTWLKSEYAKNVTVLEPNCASWTSMIESRQLDHKVIEKEIRSVCEQGADVIVLGCTHYHWIEEDIQKIANEYTAKVIQPEPAVIEQLKKVLAQQT